MSIGDSALHCDQIELILEALSTEFDLVVAIINFRPNFVSLDELESLLLTQPHVDKTRK